MDKAETLRRYRLRQQVLPWSGIPFLLLGIWCGYLALPLAFQMASPLSKSENAGVFLSLWVIIIITFAPVFIISILGLHSMARILLRCPACNRSPGKLFDQGGRCMHCQASLIDQPAYIDRQQWLGLTPSDHARVQQEFAELSEGRRRNNRSNLWVFFGLFAYTIVVELALPATARNYEIWFLMPYLIFMGIWFYMHLLPHVNCTRCGKDAYNRQNQLLFSLHCNHCGAQLIAPRRRWSWSLRGTK